jgi:hypothetical protein
MRRVPGKKQASAQLSQIFLPLLYFLPLYLFLGFSYCAQPEKIALLINNGFIAKVLKIKIIAAVQFQGHGEKDVNIQKASQLIRRRPREGPRLFASLSCLTRSTFATSRIGKTSSWPNPSPGRPPSGSHGHAIRFHSLRLGDRIKGACYR